MVSKPWGYSHEIPQLKRIDYDEGYAAGLREGARRERMALKRDYKNRKREGWGLLSDNARMWLDWWLTARSKRAKPGKK